MKVSDDQDCLSPPKQSTPAASICVILKICDVSSFHRAALSYTAGSFRFVLDCGMLFTKVRSSAGAYILNLTHILTHTGEPLKSDARRRSEVSMPLMTCA